MAQTTNATGGVTPTTPATAPLLCLTDVRFGYEADQPVVEQFTADIHAGELCAMIGPNAAGKTTLLRLMLGQLSPWSGSCAIDGDEVAGLSAPQRARQISYVPQRSALNLAFTVEQVVAMGRYAQPNAPAVVDHVLEMCDLRAVRQRAYSQLSGGQQQRVLLARAMAQVCDQPGQATGRKVMLLDEPVSNMDLRHVRQTMGLLVEQVRRGVGVLVVLHDLNLAARYAQRIWLVHEGRLVAAGTWKQVLQPEILEPVYGLGLRALADDRSDRPVFLIDDRDFDAKLS